MNKIIIFFVGMTFILSNYQSKAQESETTPPVFITLSTGINHTGLFGVGIEAPLMDKLALFADLGLGGWGGKAGAGLSFYPKSIRKGPGINLAYYTASGSGNTAVDITLDNGDTIPVGFNRVGTINLSYSQNWKMGKRGKFAFIAGYAFSAGNKTTSYTAFGELDDFAESLVGFLHPDGLILGVKFMFGVGKMR